MVQSQISNIILLADIYVCVYTYLHAYTLLSFMYHNEKKKQKITMLQMSRGNTYTGKDKVVLDV